MQQNIRTMKRGLIFVLMTCYLGAQCQQLQVHYDFRHSIDPDLNRTNFPSLNFEYFKSQDSTGSFLFKMQADFTGERSNVGQYFLQVSQNLRYWQPRVYLSLNYSGGLGIASPSYGYYITNSFGVGVAYPFQWKGAWLSCSWLYRYNAFPKPSHDAQFTFYFGRGFYNYKILAAGSIVAWTENRNQGTAWTEGLGGKKFAFFGDPQVWVKITRTVSVGSKVNLFFHVLTEEDKLNAYPTLALKKEW